MTADELTRALTARLRRVTDGDTSAVLDEQARAEAAALARTADPADPDTAALLCRFHWTRHNALPSPDGSDFEAAFRHFGAVQDHDPAAGSNIFWRDVPHADDTTAAPTQEARDLTAIPGFFERPDLVNRAVELLNRASEPDARRADLLWYLSWGLLGRRRENPGNLDRAIELGRVAVASAPPDDSRAARYRWTLGNALTSRYDATGSSADLTEAIQLTSLADPSTRSLMLLDDRSTQLRERFDRTGDPSDLDRAVDTAQHAVDLAGDIDPFVDGYLISLAAALGRRYAETGAEDDFDRAADAARRSLAATPARHPDRAARWSVCSALWASRYERTADPADLDRAVDAGRRAVDGTASDDARRAVHLSNLGSALWDPPEIGGMSKAMPYFREAAGIAGAPLRVRARAAEGWANLASLSGDWSEAGTAWTSVLELLPLLTDHGLSRDDRQHHLSLLSGVGPRAAAAALQLGRSEDAWELLELGRGILLAQSLAFRHDDKRLAAAFPALAERRRRLRRVLEVVPDDGQVPPGAVSQWSELTCEIRAQSGFERFGLPPSVNELREAADGGVVVAVTVTYHRCDALLLRGDRAGGSVVQVVPLPDLTESDTLERANTFLAAVHSPSGSATAAAVTGVLHWLWAALARPVLDHLGFTAPPPPGASWPRVWWIPTGPLSVLPLHAAGPPDGGGVIDRVVSSYAATAQALRHARKRVVRPDGPALIVGLDDVPGLPRLTYAREEAAEVRAALGSPTPPLLDAQANYETIMARLATATWAHFACHGTSADDPSDSHLALHDRRLPVRDLGRLDVDGGYLAYLSACTSGYGGVRLVDESVHLAAAFQLAGFRHAVATLWPVGDMVAADITRDVYGHLRDHPEPALALHHAVRTARRSYPDHPQLWASHVHFGP